MIINSIIQEANRYLGRMGVVERYSKPGEFFDSDDALALHRILSHAFGSIPEEQRQETMKQVFAQLLKQHPTNHSLAAVCKKLEALDLVEMHDTAALGLEEIIEKIRSGLGGLPFNKELKAMEEMNLYENLLAQARDYALYSHLIGELIRLQ
ncbi:MAG: hypothetical protein Q8R04_04630 [Nanoarchaeota archaeon]|nr:hypothetical protein [Nanoarchaeota archaeon]